MTPPSRRPPRRRRPPPARELALQILAAGESRSAYSDRLLDSRLRDAGTSAEEARLVTALVQGVLRRRATLDHHLAEFTGPNWERLPLWIRTALRIGAFQLLFLDRIPASAAVAESVELAKKYGHPGTAGLANAVLRRLAGGARAPLPDPAADPVAHLAVKHSHPEWLVRRWLARYGRRLDHHCGGRFDLARWTGRWRHGGSHGTSRDLLHRPGFLGHPVRVRRLELHLCGKSGCRRVRNLSVCLRLSITTLQRGLSPRRLHDGMRPQHDLQRRLQSPRE